MRRIERYLAREVLQVFLSTLLVLLTIIVVQRLTLLISQAASGTIGMHSIWKLIVLQTFRFLTELIPIAFLIAILMSLGRWYRDSEMAAAQACGWGMDAIYRSLLFLTLPLMALMLLLNFIIMPQVVGLQRELRAEAREEARTSLFRPGTFRVINDGEHVVYVGGISADGSEYTQVFTRSQARDRMNKTSFYATTTGSTGYQEIDEETGVRFIVLTDGQRLEQQKDSFLQVIFQQLRIRLDQTRPLDTPDQEEAASISKLLSSDTLAAKIEMQRRLGSSLTLLVVLLIAPMLAQSRMREQRSGRLVIGILIYLIYFNLQSISVTWVRKGVLNPMLGMWWVHAIFLIPLIWIVFRKTKKVSFSS